MPEQKPSIGRTVHYVADGTEQPAKLGVGVMGSTDLVISGEGAYMHRAAIVTAITQHDPCMLYLHVMTPNGTYECVDIEFDPEGKKPGTWHWPERDN